MDALDELNRIPGIPKPITPKVHRVLDYLTISAFLLLGGALWNRNKRGSIAALVNGLFVLSYTPLTDFEGDGSKPISFHTHGKLDMIQASMSAAAPTVLGFSGSHKKSSFIFRTQALNEALVIRMTDFEAAALPDERFRRAA